MEFLLGVGKAGEIKVGEETFQVICQILNSETANLLFSYAEKGKTNMSSQLIVKKGEWVNFASIIKDLNDKINKVEIRQAETEQLTGQVETISELQFK